MQNWISRWNEFLKKHPTLDIKVSQYRFNHRASDTMELAKDESFWAEVRAAFPDSKEIINLNNGAVSSAPYSVEKAFTTYYSLVNESPSYYLWKVMEQGRELIREGLANLINADKDEVAILRNATEALNNVIFGADLKPGDEVVACKQDYSKAVISWKQRELRDKIKINWVDLEGASETDETIIQKYISAITPRTKLLTLTHVINWNGQVLPVKRIIAEAKKRNVKVLLDGAHSFALLETDMKDLGCDYFVTALHKWLSGPIPSALVYVKKESIPGLWPLASSSNPLSGDIRKFEELSIQLMPNILGLGFAMEFHHHLGRENKEQRVRHLRRLWTIELRSAPNIIFLTPFEESRCCVIVNVAIKDKEPAKVEAELMEKYGIHVTTILWENMKGIRITPNIYNTPSQMSKLVEALKSI